MRRLALALVVLIVSAMSARAQAPVVIPYKVGQPLNVSFTTAQFTGAVWQIGVMQHGIPGFQQTVFPPFKAIPGWQVPGNTLFTVSGTPTFVATVPVAVVYFDANLTVIGIRQFTFVGEK